MKNKKLVLLVAIGSALGIQLQGCATSALDKKVDAEVAQEDVKTHAELRTESGQLIESTPGLTADQRVKLVALRDATRADLDSLYSQSLKLRAVLIKDLITTNYNEDEVELIKKRIKDNENKRLTVTFNAVEQANKILGRDAQSHRKLVEDFWGGRASRE
ncbi:MAG: hypothetical protein P4M08_14530 [Oligoflexia bacterium]|nr:hypothetical protein [Oligoflexia bacterium]